MPLLFVYGTLRTGGSNHGRLAGQRRLRGARLPAGWTLYDMGEYPALVRSAEAREGVAGELWEVDAGALGRLDAFEGVHEGLYRREELALAEPEGTTAAAYVFAGPVGGRRRLGAVWREPGGRDCPPEAVG